MSRSVRCGAGADGGWWYRAACAAAYAQWRVYADVGARDWRNASEVAVVVVGGGIVG
jgi:hypothetical protein